MPNKIGSVMVVGGGIAGVQASLDLAEAGYYVYLVERSSAIGGTMAALDKTFPTNDCSMCILSPKLVECGRHPNIEIVTLASLVDLQGEPGSFKATLIQAPRYVDGDKCVACGDCEAKCPVKISDEFNEGLAIKRIISNKYAQAVPNTFVITHPEKCLYLTKGVETGKEVCKLCVKACNKDAIDLDDKEKTLNLDIGAVILAPGFDEFDPTSLKSLGYGVHKNVVTSIEFERILSASGPFSGHLVRPSDHTEPKKVAWIQCVGSRDRKIGCGFCSSVCCTYAIKEAMIAKEHSDTPLDTAIFFMDMRTYGKGFEAYYNRAKDETGIRFIRSRIFEIGPGTAEDSLRIRYSNEDGAITVEDFDMVVLSVGMQPSKSAVEMAGKIGVKLNKYNFADTTNFTPIETSRPGVFVCGSFQSPMDIPTSVMQASAAAAGAGTLLAEARGTALPAAKDATPEIDVANDEARVGVFVCNCGINIGSTVDVPSVRDFAAGLPNVVYAEENLYTCSSDSQEKIKDAIKAHKLNRVVVSACTPRTHEPLFRATCAEAGLNPYLFEFGNIREQCSWVHMKDKEAATQKAKEITSRAVAKARLLESLQTVTIGVNKNALVIGGGIAGMNSALELANQGFEVSLVEKSDVLGGMARRIHLTLEGMDVTSYLKGLVNAVNANAKIKVYTSAKVKDASGYVGNFITVISAGGQDVEINHGAVIIAIGGSELKQTEYLYGQDSRVMTGLELEDELVKGSDRAKNAKNIVMINCVGSREPDRVYCSRICCSESVKNALKAKELNPEASVYVLYRDMRTYGFKEDFYEDARGKGVMFLRYDLANKPLVRDVNGKLLVTVMDPILKETFTIDADLIGLAVATVAPEDSKEMAQLYKVCGDYDGGFFLEAHMKLRPVDFPNDGVFVAGLAHGPKFIEETIAQAQAAAARVATILTKDMLVGGGAVAVVNAQKCSGCHICITLCPYNAISFLDEEKVSSVNEVLCKGCGTCVAACPSKAIQAMGFKDEQIFAEIEAFLA
ncbi:MAG: CoB--CoM heterodisulfide reductase iron-sulfur subunit A family protein [Eubacteriales bacterium]|nr:CoB--CoM heterodisulfide reductase iron-sulfur subunit A family protein [Bacillota bacterium]MBV1726482.1 CoB--CoM heterodisulfide reductase iron-sulfur subunit A family protein [Desulforudis sp.]MDP3050823.1 CoB--CoM heterodisulfide reductase iron-sulfur subunit A family protein [Eubacteriales bacterium]MBU4533755.1 CoB--CoM heterodisulfide reductase iron-sulfur subunit A family protein [Bacillota bacterium]MBU4554948.1 CoB--CoM heterodisulfide reductase iron-sulfur subunit A family protein